MTSNEWPEHEKLQLVSADSQMIGEFLEWAQITGVLVLHEPLNAILAKFFGIDLSKIENEKRAMIAELQARYEAGA